MQPESRRNKKRPKRQRDSDKLDLLKRRQRGRSGSKMKRMSGRELDFLEWPSTKNQKE